MISNIAQAHGLLTEGALAQALYTNEAEIERELAPLEEVLAVNVMSADQQTLLEHMGFVESWRSRLARMLMVISAVVEHSKSEHFALPSEKGNTEFRRDQYRRMLAGGWSAIETRLENLIESVDSRVNLCKKVMGIEGELSNVRRNRQA